MASRIQVAQSGNNIPINMADDRVMLPPQPEAKSIERQFPIPAHYSKRRSRSKRVNDVTYGKFTWLMLDKYNLDARLKNKIRVSGDKDSPCYTYDELSRYESNNFYRHWLVGAVFGGALYLLVWYWLILSEQHERFDAFRIRSFAVIYIPLILLTLLAVLVLRILAALWLNAYIIFGLQALTLVLSVFGGIGYECEKFSEAQFTGPGHIPMFLISIVEEWAGLEPDRVRMITYDLRCNQSVVRLCALNILSDFMSLLVSIRLIFV